jgi:putative DNA primase/helicase
MALSENGQPVVEKDAAPPIAEPNLRPPLKKVVKNFDEVGASLRVLAAYGDRLRSVVDRKALYSWDGQRYGDFEHIAEGLALDALDKVHLEYDEGCIHVTEDGQSVGEDDFLKAQGKFRSHGSIRKALKLARLDSRIQVKSSAFDANPYEINLLNGLFNLETQVLAPHNPSQLVTKLAPVSWVPGAPCPFWESLIDDITCRDKRLAAYLQRLCGYCSTGSTQEEVMPILYGNGANGKSRFLGALRDILGSGEYALTLGTGSILNSKYHGIRCDLRLLESMRTVFAIEANEESTMDEAVVKSIVAADEISARALYKNPVQFVPQAKIIMAVNHLPVLVGNDHGIRRRIQVVPFRKRFDGSKKKEEIESQIRTEKDGIFAWMVRGFQEWCDQGLNPPAVVRKATEDYFATNDHIGAYLEERTESVAGAKTPLRQLFEDYQAWAHGAGVKALGMHQFGDLLEGRGIAQGRTNSARHWEGIAPKAIV